MTGKVTRVHIVHRIKQVQEDTQSAHDWPGTTTTHRVHRTDQEFKHTLLTGLAISQKAHSSSTTTLPNSHMIP